LTIGVHAHSGEVMTKPWLEKSPNGFRQGLTTTPGTIQAGLRPRRDLTVNLPTHARQTSGLRHTHHGVRYPIGLLLMPIPRCANREPGLDSP
jgi:hypothetical protein